MYSVEKTKQTDIADEGKPELTQSDQAGDLPLKHIIDTLCSFLNLLLLAS